MKILVLSLLRIGDVLLHQAAISNIRKNNPQAEIHVLINDISEKICPVMVDVSKWWVLPRNKIQTSLVQEEFNPHLSFKILSDLTDSLNHEKFDVIYNLSHTKFSARLMDILNANQKHGVYFQEGQVKKMQDPWLRFFNDNFSRNSRSSFNYVSALNKSVGLEMPEVPPKPFSTSKIGAIQAFTSDTKKNWGLQNWQQFFQQIKSKYPDMQWFVLGAPDEKTKLLKYFNESDLKILNFKQLSDFFDECAYLITGDTSVQHLAAQKSVHVFSLFLGSANIFKTSAWSYNHLVLTSSESCSPCWHASPCQRTEHFCGKSIQVSEVVQSFTLWKEKDFLQLENFVNSSHLQYYKVVSLPWQSHFLWQLGGSASMKNYQRALNQITWQIYLDQQDRSQIPPFGTAALWFTQENTWNWKQNQILSAWLNRRDLSIDKLLKLIDNLKSQMAKAAADEMPAVLFAEKIYAYNAVLDIEGDYFFRFHQARQESLENNFLWFNQVRQALFECEQLLTIEKRLLKQIWNELERKEFNYVPRVAKLSEVSISET